MPRPGREASKLAGDHRVLHPYLPTLVVSFIDPAPTPTINGLLGKHVISCLDTEPEEVKGPWTEDQQSGMFSPTQAKAFWSFLKQPDLAKWGCLVFVDNGEGDRRGG
jgi:hypothetical protein